MNRNLQIFNGVVWFNLALLVLDAVSRLVIIGFWATNYSDYPNIPMFTKGVKFPEIQAVIVLMEIIAILGLFWLKRDFGRFKILIRLCMFFGIISLLLSLLYSSNVAGSAFIFFFYATYLRYTARDNRLIDSC